jgi:hypothetical protein
VPGIGLLPGGRHYGCTAFTSYWGSQHPGVLRIKPCQTSDMVSNRSTTEVEVPKLMPCT